jgi:hypothetical protein
MLNELHAFTSSDPHYVALQGRHNRVTVNIVIDSLAIDDLPGVGIKPTEAQRLDFARINLEAIREIAERKLESGEATLENRGQVPGLVVRICDIDFAEYLSSGKKLSLAALGAGTQLKWVRRAGLRFGIDLRGMD